MLKQNSRNKTAVKKPLFEHFETAIYYCHYFFTEWEKSIGSVKYLESNSF